MTQIVLMLYEDPQADSNSDKRFHLELHFSPGVKSLTAEAFKDSSFNVFKKCVALASPDGGKQDKQTDEGGSDSIVNEDGKKNLGCVGESSKARRRDSSKRDDDSSTDGQTDIDEQKQQLSPKSPRPVRCGSEDYFANGMFELDSEKQKNAIRRRHCSGRSQSECEYYSSCLGNMPAAESNNTSTLRYKAISKSLGRSWLRLILSCSVNAFTSVKTCCKTARITVA